MKTTFDPCKPLVLGLPAGATPAQLQSIDDAVKLWHAVGVQAISLDPTPGAQVLPLQFQDAAPNFYGIYLDQTGVIVLNTRLTDRKQRAITLAHELGHAWGQFHVDPATRVSVMNVANLTVPPLPGDAEAVLGHWGGACASRGVAP